MSENEKFKLREIGIALFHETYTIFNSQNLCCWPGEHCEKDVQRIGIFSSINEILVDVEAQF